MKSHIAVFLREEGVQFEFAQNSLSLYASLLREVKGLPLRFMHFRGLHTGQHTWGEGGVEGSP